MVLSIATRALAIPCFYEGTLLVLYGCYAYYRVLFHALGAVNFSGLLAMQL